GGRGGGHRRTSAAGRGNGAGRRAARPRVPGAPADPHYDKLRAGARNNAPGPSGRRRTPENCGEERGRGAADRPARGGRGARGGSPGSNGGSRAGGVMSPGGGAARPGQRRS